VLFRSPSGTLAHEMGSAYQSRFKPAAGGRIDVAVVDVGKLLLLASIRRPEVLLPTKADRE